MNQVTTPVLDYLGKTMIEINKSINPVEFLQTRKGLTVDLKLDRVLGRTCKQIGDSISISRFKLKKRSNDSDIKNELHEDFIFDVGTFRTFIATLINKQWNCEAGVLLNNGFDNIFYVWDEEKRRCFTVSVFHKHTDRSWKRWRVEVFTPTTGFDSRRYEGSQIFSRN